MAASNLLNLHQSETIAANNSQLLYQSILLAVFTLILNHRDSGSDQQALCSPNVPKSTLFYFQMTNHIITKLKDAHGSDDASPAKLIATSVEEKIVQYVQTHDFSTSGAGKLMQSLVKFSVFLQSQQGEKLLSESLLKLIKEKQTDEEGAKFKRFMHQLLSFACQLGYHKTVQESLGEEYHEFLPNQDNLKACFEFVLSKDKR